MVAHQTSIELDHSAELALQISLELMMAPQILLQRRAESNSKVAPKNFSSRESYSYVSSSAELDDRPSLVKSTHMFRVRLKSMEALWTFPFRQSYSYVSSLTELDDIARHFCLVKVTHMFRLQLNLMIAPKTFPSRKIYSYVSSLAELTGSASDFSCTSRAFNLPPSFSNSEFGRREFNRTRPAAIHCDTQPDTPTGENETILSNHTIRSISL